MRKGRNTTVNMAKENSDSWRKQVERLDTTQHVSSPRNRISSKLDLSSEHLLSFFRCRRNFTPRGDTGFQWAGYNVYRLQWYHIVPCPSVSTSSKGLRVKPYKTRRISMIFCLLPLPSSQCSFFLVLAFFQHIQPLNDERNRCSRAWRGHKFHATHTQCERTERRPKRGERIVHVQDVSRL